MNAVGAIGDFIDTPCHTVALQGVVFHEQANVGDLSLGDAYRNIAARLYTESITRDQLIVKWECTSLSKVEDISYMVIGDVAEKEVRGEEKPPAKP